MWGKGFWRSLEKYLETLYVSGIQHSHHLLRVRCLNAAVKSAKIAWAFVELRCTFGGRSIVPDLTVFCWERIPRNENGGVANVFALAPDWTLEILSPGQSQTKVTKNILHCLQHGTQMGWLIDPIEQTVFVYAPEPPTQFYDEPAASLPVPAFAETVRLQRVTRS
ncbi:MAG: Uma2 family endonuclease [Spirulinaceae cyanobacterium SM2_1_0]|nr:Uma2 family endonuclease [Spirulinaceae cyanobacterium SM2_1_0]